MNTKVKQNMAYGKKEDIGKEPKRGQGGNTVRSVEIKFPLTPMGVLAPGSAHARPSAQTPIDE
jgi:hypothetical protein